MSRCVVKNCTFKLFLNDLFGSPENKELLKQWQKAVDTNLVEFGVCDLHFAKKDLIVERNLKKNSVPSLNLNDVIIKLENDCCGFCLDKLEVKHEIQQRFINSFKEICGYEPLTDFMCQDCTNSILKYKEFKTEIQKKHKRIREAAKAKMELMEAEADECMSKVIKQEPKEPAKIFSCNFCHKFNTNDISDLGKHLKERHNLKCDDKLAKIITERWATPDGAKDKIEAKNFEPINVPKVDSDPPVQTTSKSSRKQSFQSNEVLAKTDEDLEVCQHCFELVSTRNLEAHLKTSHKVGGKRIFICHVCSKAFPEKFHLSRHLNIHFPELKMICDICGRKCHRKDIMARHMKTHLRFSDVDDEKCKICLKIVALKNGSIGKHMKMYHPKGYDCGARVNSETNYFDCTQCGASYADLFTYRRHDCEKGRYQLRCPDCQKPIRNSEKLRIHQKNGCKTINQFGGFYWSGARFKK